MRNEKKTPKEFKGLPISSGKVVGRVCVYSNRYHNQLHAYTIEDDAALEHELRRFNEARELCTKALDESIQRVEKDIGKAEAEIFVAQRDILNDPMILHEIETRLKQNRKNIESVISDVFKQYELKFSSFGNTYINERYSDVSDVKRRLIDTLLNTTSSGFLCESPSKCSMKTDSIIVTETLTADMMLNLNFQHVLALVTEHGGYSSHAAILARAIGVPAVSGVSPLYSEVNCDDILLVDGDNGIVVMHPDEATIAQLTPVDPVLTETICHLTSPAGTEVMANASMVEDAQLAAAVHADGIGLFRTEIAFMNAKRPLSEEEQFTFYSRIVSIMQPRPVVFRLLDIGGDKEIPFIGLPKESNPFLGLRGARLLLHDKALFATQARALLRLTQLITPVKILIPMVIDAIQAGQIRSAIGEIADTMGIARDAIRIGAMFEVPSACLEAEAIFTIVDFASIGSNDLIQYLFAVDRSNENVAYDYNPDHPVLWKTMEQLGRAAKNAGKPISICGEMAGKAEMPRKLIGIGLTTLSVHPRLIPRVRNELAHVFQQ